MLLTILKDCSSTSASVFLGFESNSFNSAVQHFNDHLNSVAFELNIISRILRGLRDRVSIEVSA